MYYRLRLLCVFPPDLHPLYGAHEERMVNPFGFLHCFFENLRGSENSFLSFFRIHVLAFTSCLQQFIIYIIHDIISVIKNDSLLTLYFIIIKYK